MSTTVEEIEKTETSKDAKSKLLLDSLEIKGYRCFEHLTIEKLGRVNLIVGKNNVGKTALLEALRIYANHRDSGVIQDIIFERNESSVKNNLSLESSKESSFAARNLLFNRPVFLGKLLPVKDSDYFIITEAGRDLDYIKDRMLSYDIEKDDFNSKFDQAVAKAVGAKTTLVFYDYDTSDKVPRLLYFPKKDRDINNLFVNSKGLDTEKLIQFWDLIALTSLEDEVIKALSPLLPKLKRIDFIGYPNGSTHRVPVVRVDDVKERLPLKSFGEGMTRLLGISLSLVQCENGMLLIDEIESGLHYSVLLDVWRFIFKTARDLNVQVFATTHSSDCIKAFQRAAEEDKQDEGMLIRLVRKGDKIKAVLFDEKELETVVENDIEVR